MARQDNPFALLGYDDEGDDLSVLLAKVEAKMPAPPPVAVEQPKMKVHELPSKPPAPDYVREERGRGRGSRGRGPGRGGFGIVGGLDAIEQQYNDSYRGYSGEFGGGRNRGRGGRGGVSRGRGVTGFVNRNQLDYENLGGVMEEGVESQEKVNHVESRPVRYGSRNFVEEKQGKDGEETEHFGFRGYGDRENRGFRGYGADLENRGGFRGYGADLENRGFRDGEGHEGRGYGGDRENRGFRGGGGRRGGYGARGQWCGRDNEHGGAHYESNGRWNAFETKDISIDEKEPIANDTTNENWGTGSVDPSAVEEPKNGQHEKPLPVESLILVDPSPAEEPKIEQHEKPLPEPISSEDTSKVLEEDNEMTLAEYEKLLQEKRKTLESLKTQSRKVEVDKDFEGMQIIDKKKEHGIIKLKSDIDKGKKKEITEREEKSRKSLNINEFLKPADGERYRGPASSRGRGGRGRGRGGGYTSDYPSRAAAAAAPPLEDTSHFPNLRPVAKA